MQFSKTLPKGGLKTTDFQCGSFNFSYFKSIEHNKSEKSVDVNLFVHCSPSLF